MMERNKSIDFLRYLFSFFVISIHADLGIESGRILWLVIQTISRIAVPFFCMVTGHYYCKKVSILDKKKSFLYTLNYLKRLIITYLIASLPDLIIRIINFNMINSGTLLELIKELLTTGIWGHLWYFPAVTLSIAILWFLKFHFGLNRSILLFSSLLYCFICLGDVYSGLIEKFDLLSRLFNSNLYISFFRGVSYAFCFIVLGGSIEKIKRQINIEKTCALLLSIAFMVILFAEEFITYNVGWNTRLTLALCYYPFMTAFMCWILCDPLHKWINSTFFNYRCAANFTYYFHPFLLAIESRVIDNSLLLCFTTVLLMFILNLFGQRYVPKIYFHIAN